MAGRLAGVVAAPRLRAADIFACTRQTATIATTAMTELGLTNSIHRGRSNFQKTRNPVSMQVFTECFFVALEVEMQL
jgi:hypothetical protein